MKDIPNILFGINKVFASLLEEKEKKSINRNNVFRFQIQLDQKTYE